MNPLRHHLLRLVPRGLHVRFASFTESSLTFSKLRQSFIKRESTAIDVVENCFQQIKKDAILNNLITSNMDGALEHAARLDNARPTSSLAGIPFVLKDNFTTANLRTTCGSKILDSFVPDYDSAVAEILQKNNAILLGKSNMDGFAMGSFTLSSDYGPVLCHTKDGNTEKPRKLTLSGGSSGGSACAVASQHCSFAIGSDTGGSVRLPAAYCNVVGFKPSYGLISRWGLISYASSLDVVGILANTIRDAADVFDVLLVPDKRDPSQLNEEQLGFIRDQSVDFPCKTEKVTIGVPLESLYTELSPDILSYWTRLLEKLSTRFAIRFVSIPHWQHALSVYYAISSAEAASNLSRYDGIRYGYRNGTHSATFSDLMTKTRGGGFSHDIQHRILAGNWVLDSLHNESMYIRAQKVRRLLSDDFSRAFQQADIFLTPTSPCPAPTMSQRSNQDIDDFLMDSFTVPASLAGIPAINLPSDWFEPDTSFGIQLMAPYGQDKKVLAIAELIQHHLK